jgi:hypothetical protein
MRILTNLSNVLDKEIHELSAMTDENLNLLMLVVERAYIHTLIEKQLRANYVGVSYSVKGDGGE